MAKGIQVSGLYITFIFSVDARSWIGRQTLRPHHQRLKTSLSGAPPEKEQLVIALAAVSL